VGDVAPFSPAGAARETGAKMCRLGSSGITFLGFFTVAKRESGKEMVILLQRPGCTENSGFVGNSKGNWPKSVKILAA